MSLGLGWHIIVLIGSLLVAAAASVFYYRRTKPQTTGGRQKLLTALRFLTLGTLLFLLAQPILTLFSDEDKPAVLAVVVDASQSLSQQAGTQFDAEGQTRQVLRDLELQDSPADVRLYSFDRTSRPLVGDLGEADSLRFDGSRTDISQALTSVKDDLQNDNLRGVILISDGRYNTGRNPVYVSERFPVPIHTITVGDTTDRIDLQVRRLSTNEIAYVDTELPVQIGVRSTGFEGQRVTVGLYENDQQVGKQNVTLPKGSAELAVDLSYTPAKEGLVRLTAGVTRLDGEVTYANNTRSRSLRILENKQRILLLANAPTPDLGSISQILRADPATELTIRTQKDRTSYYEGSFPEDLAGFDLVILAGYPGKSANPAHANRIVAAADEGLPVLFLLGRQTDLAQVASVWRNVLPAQPATIRTGFIEASLNVTPEGEVDPVMIVPDLPYQAWRQLPPLQYNESRWEASPDARTLSAVDVRGVSLNDPLLVVRKRGNSRAAALLGSGSWRWYNVPEDLEAARGFWQGLVNNMVKWLTTREDQRRVRISPVADLFDGGDQVQLTGQVYDESLNPLSDAVINLEITSEDGTDYDYQMETIGNGRYLTNAGLLPEGNYRYSASASSAGGEIGTDAGSFSVGKLTLEFSENGADAGLMRQIAARSAGGFHFASDASNAMAGIQSSGTLTELSVAREKRHELWQYLPLLLLLFVLLTAEWVIRKRAGMV